jgi:hypothetical protein
VLARSSVLLPLALTILQHNSAADHNQEQQGPVQLMLLDVQVQQPQQQQQQGPRRQQLAAAAAAWQSGLSGWGWG